MSRVEGFAPLAAPGVRVLVLGSVPSVASLAKGQYYGKPQNAFWRIMGELFGAGPELPYTERTRRLVNSGVAVWDVVAACVRPGSLDSAIATETVEVNDFVTFLRRHPGIAHVFFNGRKAEELWRRCVQADVDALRPGLCYACLPSTSPAMATLDFAAKLERWRVVATAAGAR